MGDKMTRFFSCSAPMRVGWNIAGAVSSAADPTCRANAPWMRAAKSLSLSLRFSKVIRRERVSRLKTNSSGSWSAYMPMFSNHSRLACAARWVDSTTGLRSCW